MIDQAAWNPCVPVVSNLKSKQVIMSSKEGKCYQGSQQRSFRAIRLKDKRGSYYLRVDCFSAVRMLSAIVYRGSAGKPKDAKDV